MVKFNIRSTIHSSGQTFSITSIMQCIRSRWRRILSISEWESLRNHAYIRSPRNLQAGWESGARSPIQTSCFAMMQSTMAMRARQGKAPGVKLQPQNASRQKRTWSPKSLRLSARKTRYRAQNLGNFRSVCTERKEPRPSRFGVPCRLHYICNSKN